jgi:hypothetical protein
LLEDSTVIKVQSSYAEFRVDFCIRAGAIDRFTLANGQSLSGREGSALGKHWASGCNWILSDPSNLLVFNRVFWSSNLQFLQFLLIFNLFPVDLSCCGSIWVKGKGSVIRNHGLRTGKTGRQNTS